MKNLSKLLATLVVIGLTLHKPVKAQERDAIKLGIKGGFGFSNIYDTEGENFEADPKLGFTGGGFLSIPLGKLIGVQPEVLYTMKGFEATGTFLGNRYNLKRTSYHIDIPIQLMIKPIDALTLLVGPQYSYTLSNSDNFNYADININNTQEFDNSNIRKNTLGIVGGVDLNISKLILSGRAGWDIQKNNGDGTSSEIRYKNVWFLLTIGINIL